MSAPTVARVGDHVAEGFTAADLNQILHMPGEQASVARAANGYHVLPRPSRRCGRLPSRNGR